MSLVFSVLKHLTNGAIDVQKFIAKFAEHLLGFAFGAVVDGSEIGGKLFNAIDAGGDVTANSQLKASGAHVLTPAQVAEIDTQANVDQIAIRP